MIIDYWDYDHNSFAGADTDFVKGELEIVIARKARENFDHTHKTAEIEYKWQQKGQFFTFWVYFCSQFYDRS